MDDLLFELVELCIHQVLYCRRLYPECVFQKQSFLEVGVMVCLHPDVNSYLQSQLATLKGFFKQLQQQPQQHVMSSGLRFDIEMAIVDGEDAVIEAFVFQVAKKSSRNTRYDGLRTLRLFTKHLRRCMLKLQSRMSDVAVLNATLDTSRTFRLRAHCQQPFNHNSDWQLVPAASKKSKAGRPASWLPIHFIRRPISLHIFLQTGEAISEEIDADVS